MPHKLKASEASETAVPLKAGRNSLNSFNDQGSGSFQYGREPLGGGLDALLQRVHGDEREEFAEALPGKIAQRLFPAAEHHVHFYLMPYFEELFGLLGAKLKVVTAGLEADAEHFYLACALALGPVFTLFSCLVILEFAKIHYPDDRRVGGRRDLDHIEPPLFGNAEGLLQLEFTEILPGLVNGAYARGADLVVDAVAAEDDWCR